MAPETKLSNLVLTQTQTDRLVFVYSWPDASRVFATLRLANLLITQLMGNVYLKIRIWQLLSKRKYLANRKLVDWMANIFFLRNMLSIPIVHRYINVYRPPWRVHQLRTWPITVIRKECINTMCTILRFTYHGRQWRRRPVNLYVEQNPITTRRRSGHTIGAQHAQHFVAAASQPLINPTFDFAKWQNYHFN